MRVANVEHQGRKKVALSADGTSYIDFTAALQIWETATARESRLPAHSIQDLLDTNRFEVQMFVAVTEFLTAHGLDGCLSVRNGMRLLAPFRRPGQIIALARNYRAHASESTLPPPREPIFFCKSNTSVIGPGDAIVLPPNLGRIEPEIELAVIIRKEASHVPAERVADYIAGYTILNDVSAQELQAREIEEMYPLFRCKSLKTFTPMGPCVLTVDRDGLNPLFDMTLRVNGEPRVATNSGGLTFGIAQLVEFITGFVVLYPGDVISTGCPKSAGAIHAGDAVELEIEGIGVLANPVVASHEPCPAWTV